jgi:thiol:disulfide interchange protein
MKATLFFAPVFAAFVFLCACNGSKSTTSTTPKAPKDEPIEVPVPSRGVQYAKDDNLLSAQLRARNERKPIFMDFYTTWCAPCKMMDESLFVDEDVTDLLNNSCVPLKINAERGNGPALQTQFAVTGYPTFVFTDENGNVLAQHRGTISIAEFKKMAKTAVWKMSQNK